MWNVLVRMMSYGAASIIFFLLDLIFVYVLTEFFAVHYVTSVVIGFTTTTAGLFFANRAWTFDAHVHPVRGITYATCVALVALAIITLVPYFRV